MSPKTLVSPCALMTMGWLLNNLVHSWDSVSRSAAALEVLEPSSFTELSKKNLVMAWMPETGVLASRQSF